MCMHTINECIWCINVGSIYALHPAKHSEDNTLFLAAHSLCTSTHANARTHTHIHTCTCTHHTYKHMHAHARTHTHTYTRVFQDNVNAEIKNVWSWGGGGGRMFQLLGRHKCEGFCASFV